MKFTNILTSFLIISFAIFFVSSCEKKDEIIPDDPFELEGTWTLTQVTTNAPLLGDYTDAEPNGNVIFNEDGTGSANYSFDAIGLLSQGVPVNRNDTFSWIRTGNVITLIASDDETTEWTIVNEFNNDFQVTWTQSVSGVDTVDYHAFMTK